MKIFLLFLSLFFYACGVDVHTNNPEVTVKGNVVHTVQIDLTKLTENLYQLCERSLRTEAPPEEIEECVNNALSKILL